MCVCISRATQIKTYSWDNAQVILVGNKCDLEDDRLVATEDGQRLADELGMSQGKYPINPTHISHLEKAFLDKCRSENTFLSKLLKFIQDQTVLVYFPLR